MADITRLVQIGANGPAGVDLTTNTPVVATIKIGGVTNTEITKAITDNLVALQNGTDFSTGTNSHTHDGRYYTKTQLNSTTGGSSGAKQIGVSATPSHYTAATADVEAHLAGIDTALGAASGATQLDGTFKIENTADNTKAIAFDASSITTSTTRTLKMANANVDLANLTNSNIAAAAAIARSKLAALTANRAMVTDGSGNDTVSATTDTEIGYVSGVTSAIQTQLNATEKTANKNVANGYAGLDSGGKVAAAQLPSTVMNYRGAWNASTNSPTLADGTGSNGDVYRASVAGTQNLGSGSQTWAIGDLAIYNGTIWQHSPAADGVSSVNGNTGAVTVNAINQLTGDITAGPASGSASAAATIAAGAVTAAKLATVTDGVTLDQSGSGSTLEIKSGGVGTTQLAAAAVTAAKLGSVTDGTTLDQSGAGSTIEVKALGIGTAQLAAAAVTAAKIATGAFDQATITGGAGTPAAVQNAPAVTFAGVAGTSFTANTTVGVRWGITANSETAGRLYPCDITGAATSYCIGIATVGSGVSAGGALAVTRIGSAAKQSSDPTLVVGAPIFLTTAGVLTMTAPSSAGTSIIRVGIASTTTTIDVTPVFVGVN